MFVVLCSAVFGLKTGDSLQTTLVDNDSLGMTPAFVRGRLILHAPLMTFNIDSTGGDKSIWVPGPEFGFVFTPTMTFKDYYLEFPIGLQTIPPFLDKWGALGDFYFGASMRTYDGLGFGMSFRYLRAKYYPEALLVNGYMWTLDLGFPIKKINMRGIKFDWLISADMEYFTGSRPIKRYDGSAMFLTPYWQFDLSQGNIEMNVRMMFYSNFRGTKQDGSLHKPNIQNIYEAEIIYTYP